MDNLTSQEIISYICAFLVGLFFVVLFWKKLGLFKTLLMILVCFLIDTDHFLFNSEGFREHPTEGQVIMHAFHTIELAAFIISINVLLSLRTIKKGFINWLFPVIQDYPSKYNYYFVWMLRIILLGTLLHYAQDIPIYAIQWKWGYYDYSILHYLMCK